MPGRNIRLLAIVSLLLGAPLSIRGQRDSAPRLGIPRPILSSVPERIPLSPIHRAPPLFQIIHAAGTIFSGRVTAIARVPDPGNHGPQTVAITFRVERAIRGAVAGQDLTITQWIGLWTAGQRYRVGERVLLFLYPPSKLGLTSCVAGPLGRFAVDASGRIVLSEQHSTAFQADPLLGGKSSVTLSDFSQAVLPASVEE